ncbi:RNA-directed DNA polymerase, eukaryota, reverse transcriptase zinc-binding domain protein, partial [Tanacetum coccineum]
MTLTLAPNLDIGSLVSDSSVCGSSNFHDQNPIVAALYCPPCWKGCGAYGLNRGFSDDEGSVFCPYFRWDHKVTIEKHAPSKIPVWIKLFIVPLEAWSIKGTRTLSSRLRRLRIMDQMTADMCNKGTGKLGYARVLVEIEANKGLHDSIEINYVFGHSSFICNVRPTTVEEIEKTKTKINTYNRKDGFEEVKNIRDKGKENRVPNTPAENEIENDKDKLKGKDVIDGEPPDLEKVWNIGRSNVNELRRSANKY